MCEIDGQLEVTYPGLDMPVGKISYFPDWIEDL